MKIKYISKISLLLLAGMAFITSCTSSFDDVNTDPDNSPTAIPTNELAYLIYNSSNQLFDNWFDLNESCTFSGQICKLSYVDESKYEFRPNVNSEMWEYIYDYESTTFNMMNRARSLGNTNITYVGKIWEAQLMQIITDRWRDVPFSDICKGSTGTYSPTYDTQETIYPKLLSLLKEAADSLNMPTATGSLGAGDIMYGGDLTKWKEYCNSLRLRIAMRISKVSGDEDLAKSTVEEILNDPTDYPIITSNDDNAFYKWAGMSEAWAVYYQQRPNEYGVSDVMINELKSLDDPRLPVYALPNDSGKYIGFIIGDSVSQASPIKHYSHIGTRFMARDGSTGFTPYFRAAETYFIISEAAMLGWNTGSYGTQESAYDKAVTLSLEENSISDADIATYLAGNGKYDGTANQLYWQEWIALFKQGMEAWSLYRRTGVPTTNYIAPGSTYYAAKTHKTPPLRYPYPQTELDLNTTNNAPYEAKVVDNYWGEPMIYDQRNADK